MKSEPKEDRRRSLLYDIWLDRLLSYSANKKVELLARFGSSEQFYKEGAELYFKGNKRKITEGLHDADKQLIYMKEKFIGGIRIDTAFYPQWLREIKDPPFLLYVKGNATLLENPGLAIVGARQASLYGKWVAGYMASEAAALGITVISGMAAGIDTEAHKGALEAGGKTIAVLGCGVDLCYPRINRNLMREIEEKGLLVSEFLPGIEPKPFHFPLRNRIISGLAQNVVVAEAGLRSGSLITAELAAEQGRDVYAVPGNINQKGSLGTNRLIRDGAIPLTAVSDLFDDFIPETAKNTKTSQNPLGTDEKLLYDTLLDSGETTLDGLCRGSGFTPSKVNGLVTIMEIKGIVKTWNGKIYIAK